MADDSLQLPVARGPSGDITLLPRMANRHGLVAGATGTGKTVTLRVLAENFSRIGVPVFMADIKGDLSGMALPGGENPRVAERVKEFALDDWKPEGYPVVFWDLFGEQGHPVRTTVSEMGPLLLARLLNLNETQAGVLSLVFRIADDEGLLLLDLKDLRAILTFAAENAADLRTRYGNVSAASVGAIQRGLLTLEEQGGNLFFGEPALDLDDLIQTLDGKGVVNILAADKLIHSPRLYGTFLLWLLSELYENLPEVGDPDRPKLVFFFDEAHLLFDEAPPALREKVEQVVRLVRSKGVGIYFVSQSPLDIPEEVLGQLGNRVQHALRAFTPRDQKAVRTAAETFRPRPGLDTAAAITEMGTGEALVSVLEGKGTPTMVERAFVFPPRSRLTPLTPEERKGVTASSLLRGRYEQAVDRQSAYEILKERASRTPEPPPATRRENAQEGIGGGAGDLLGAAAKSAVRAMGSQLGRQIVRGILGSILGGGRRR